MPKLSKSLSAALAGQAGESLYVDDVFSTYLYNGTATNVSHQIQNGIDLAGEGGLVWIKKRDSNISNTDHYLSDTERGNYYLASNKTNAQAAGDIASYNSDGWTFNASTGLGTDYLAAQSYASWTFRKAPGFFDVVTYTGDGNDNRTVSHNLGSSPGVVIVKKTDASDSWIVWHRSVPTGYLSLNVTSGLQSYTSRIKSANDTTFTLGTSGQTNSNGASYVAYLFADGDDADAQIFGTDGDQAVVKCGSYTGNGSYGKEVNLGFEPQWVMIKKSSGTGNWIILDNMRGYGADASSLSDVSLFPNLSNAETNYDYSYINSTGFNLSGDTDFNASGGTYIYIAIRRPHKPAESGSEVFSVKNYTATSSSAEVTHDVNFDLEMSANRDAQTSKFLIVDKIRNINGVALSTSTAGSETTYPTYWSRKDQYTMYAPSAYDDWWASGSGSANHISYGLVRAPGFFDVVAYEGNGTAGRTVDHNLGVAPEMMIVKMRSSTQNWCVYNPNGRLQILNSSAAEYDEATTDNYFGDESSVIAPTSTQFTVGSAAGVNSSGQTYIAYLFASQDGISKVGSYTGNGGASQDIDCGFSNGARLVLVKAASGTGDWWIWDTERGITAGNDSSMRLNTTDAEVTTLDFIDPLSSGFTVVGSDSSRNGSGIEYIFLAIA